MAAGSHSPVDSLPVPAAPNLFLHPQRPSSSAALSGTHLYLSIFPNANLPFCYHFADAQLPVVPSNTCSGLCRDPPSPRAYFCSHGLPCSFHISPLSRCPSLNAPSPLQTFLFILSLPFPAFVPCTHPPSTAVTLPLLFLGAFSRHTRTSYLALLAA